MSDETNNPVDPSSPEATNNPDATNRPAEPSNLDPNVDPNAPGEHWPEDPGPAQVATTPAPTGSPPPARPSWKTWVAVAVTAAVVGAAAVFGISAATSSDSPNAAASTQPGASTGAPEQGQRFQGPNGQNGRFGRPGAFGTISNIDGSNLTIKDQSGTSTKVVTSDSTTVNISETGSVSDIKVGDTVMVAGTTSGSEIAATRVTDDGKVSADANGSRRTNDGTGNGPPVFNGNGPPGGQRPDGAQGPGGASNMGMTRGVVKSVGDGTFIVTGMDGTDVTVTTSSDTTVTVTKAAAVSDLKVGDTVMVVGDSANGAITATSIREGALGGPGGGPGAFRGSAPSGSGSQ